MSSLSMCLALATAGLATAFVPQMSMNNVLTPFKEGRALKVISGLQNFDQKLVENVAKASAFGGASCIDIAADPALVRAAKAVSDVPVCVSAINPALFPLCVQEGAEMIELGNFDPFYEQGLTFTAQDVIDMTMHTRELLPDIPLSVTVPHTLCISDQVDLAVRLEALGADLIQTEGKVSINPSMGGVQGAIEKAAPTLAAAYAISRAVNIPVMAASGLCDVTAPMALAAGASGVGVGSAVNKLDTELDMTFVIRGIADAMGIAPPEEQPTRGESIGSAGMPSSSSSVGAMGSYQQEELSRSA